MSIRVVGGAGGNPALVATYSIPATITKNPPLTIIPNPPMPPALPPRKMFVIDGNVTTCPDNPGMSSAPAKAVVAPDQVTALRSATVNTASAFGLPISSSADRATRLQTREIYSIVLIPPIVIDEAVMPK